MKIVILDGYRENPGDLSWAGLEALGEVTVYDRTPVEETVARIGDAEAVFVNKAPITRETMEKCPNLKFIGVLATGYNIVDIPASRDHGIVVTNIPAYGSPAVAQHTIALLLEMCLHVGHHSQAVAEGRWGTDKDWCFWDYPLIELQGKTLGIIGFGDIGRRVAQAALGLGMKVIACASRPRSDSGMEGVTMATQEEILASADVISLHCPLTDTNKGLICAETIAGMKDGVLLINTARGGLIVEEDLKAALISGKVAGAALDVLSVEPPRQGNLLIGVPNCIITPHIAWAPKESRQRLMDVAVANLKAFAEGCPVNVVNK